MADAEYLTGYVTKLYKDCPKPNGWNGWFFELDDGTVLRCKIQHGSWIHSNMYLTIVGKCVVKSNYIECQVEHADIARSQKALVSYLSSSDFPGIGRLTAEKLYRTFGANVLDVIDTNSVLLKTAGLSDKQVDVLTSGRLTYSLANVLKLLELKPSMIEKIKDKYGRNAMQIIQDSPYSLLHDFAGERGFTFKNVDQVALSVGVKKEDPKRIDAAIYYVVSDWLNTGGHICCNLSDKTQRDTLMHSIRGFIDTSNVTDRMIFDAIKAHNNLVIDPYQIQNYIMKFCYTKSSYFDECESASHIASMIKSRPLFHVSRQDILQEIEDYEMLSGIQLDDVQRDAVVMALTNRLSIITGGPGCGKTTVVACILFVWRRMGLPMPVLSAPTGLAVKRLTDSIINNMSGYDDSVKVKTIARRLTEAACLDKNSKHNSTLAIVDETSMVNLKDAADLLELLKNCQIVFVGDADQLPAIDPGDFFADLCNIDKVPKQFLNTCYRAVNAQVVIDNAHKIRDGVDINGLNWSTNAFKMQQFQCDNEHAVNYLVNQYVSFVNSGCDYSKLCILSPTKKYLLGTGHLNIVLQERLNPAISPVFVRVAGELMSDKKGVPIEHSEYFVKAGANTERTTFRVGDRVLQTKNRYEKNLVNGDCGVILSYHKPDSSQPYIKLRLDDGRTLCIDDEDFGDLVLAYAVTVHKAQGSEYEHVLLAMPDVLTDSRWNIDNFTTRNLVYTAVTRAKYTVEIVGSVNLLQKCIATPRPFRISLFSNRVIDAIS